MRIRRPTVHCILHLCASRSYPLKDPMWQDAASFGALLTHFFLKFTGVGCKGSRHSACLCVHNRTTHSCPIAVPRIFLMVSSPCFLPAWAFAHILFFLPIFPVLFHPWWRPRSFGRTPFSFPSTHTRITSLSNNPLSLGVPFPFVVIPYLQITLMIAFLFPLSFHLCPPPRLIAF